MSQKKKSKSTKIPQRAISVSGGTYASLRQVVRPGSLQKLVDGLVAGALDDPAILARTLARCREREPLS